VKESDDFLSKAQFAMPDLILIKHAPPLVEPEVPSDQWRLSQRGVELCAGSGVV
jgi:hypothetical protein